MRLCSRVSAPVHRATAAAAPAARRRRSHSSRAPRKVPNRPRSALPTTAPSGCVAAAAAVDAEPADVNETHALSEPAAVARRAARRHRVRRRRRRGLPRAPTRLTDAAAVGGGDISLEGTSEAAEGPGLTPARWRSPSSRRRA